ncbi:HD domain protein [Marinobacterium lacunae]|uniref:HD domain protein n=1 Tax=Marinobacterium lacunae TaxID=1232683 RepID=A0A081FXI7_9GAMM|nr:HDOD domain-containing protein [Marinobacterium lacunae]KEA63242.1 HD domain protein [Marinobacterium lacunae]MBR9882756.1 HDOD domain-containing protein [Oceanospirillales bacterium]
MKYQTTLNAVYAQLDRLGDLPIFSATVNRIRQISSSRESDAMALAMAVMKDANLSAKLLKIANTPHYNRGHGDISVVSRAVVLIGFERIQNLSMTLKLIETFSVDEPGTGMDTLLVSAFLNAAMAREIAMRSGAMDIEESYICGLLYRLGEIVVAYTLPERYRKMLKLRALGREQWERIQLAELGGHFSDIGQDLTQSWGFPKSVVQAMDSMSAEQLKPSHRLNHLLAAGCHDLLELIYYRDTGRELDYGKRLKQLASCTGLTHKELETAISNSFRQVCDICVEYGLPAKVLIPPYQGSGNDQLDELSRQLAFYISSRSEQFQAAAPAATVLAEPHSARPSQDQLQLDYLAKMNELLAEGVKPTAIVALAVEAIERCSTLDRVAFCLLSNDRSTLSARIVKGLDAEVLSKQMHLSSSEPKGQLFVRLVEKGSTLLVADCGEQGWAERLPQDFIRTVAPTGFVAAPLRVGDKPVGLFYADTIQVGKRVDEGAFRVFNQFLIQARLALEVQRHSERSS